MSYFGFDDMIKQLKKMSDGAKELSETKSIPLSELFTQSFMEKCSSFSSFGDFLDYGHFNADTQEAFESIPEDIFNKFVSENTSYDNWNNMLEDATDQYISNKLGFS